MKYIFHRAGLLPGLRLTCFCFSIIQVLNKFIRGGNRVILTSFFLFSSKANQISLGEKSSFIQFLEEDRDHLQEVGKYSLSDTILPSFTLPFFFPFFIHFPNIYRTPKDFYFVEVKSMIGSQMNLSLRPSLPIIEICKSLIFIMVPISYL